ncbi:hypothetical protein Pelo_5229 [Pelomyxa schiedti]|nr:hypothetical protein Pelo_5229 [Pelomyxa schiedti]
MVPLRALLVSFMVLVGSRSVVYGDTKNNNNCTYSGYGTFSVLNNMREMTVSYSGGNVSVTAVDYCLGSLSFAGKPPDGADDFSCDYPGASGTNGWTVTFSGYGGTIVTVSRNFTMDEYTTFCAETEETPSGYQVSTTVYEETMPLVTGINLDGTPAYVTIWSPFYDVSVLPSSTSAVLECTVEDSVACGATVSATLGLAGETANINIVTQVVAPWTFVAINPSPVEIPADAISAVVLVTSEVSNSHSTSQASGLITVVPQSGCKVYGELSFLTYICTEDENSCSDVALDEMPSFATTIFLDIPENCSEMQAHDSSTTLYIRTSLPDGTPAYSVAGGDTLIIEEIITTSVSVPDSICSCLTDLMVYDWAGNIVGAYYRIENNTMFATKKLNSTPLYNKFSTILPADLFPSDNVVWLQATCQLSSSTPVYGVILITVGSSETTVGYKAFWLLLGGVAVLTFVAYEIKTHKSRSQRG